jgi:hypothetical protein
MKNIFFTVVTDNMDCLYAGPHTILAETAEQAEATAQGWDGTTYVSAAVPAVGFISRHRPTGDQYDLIAKMGGRLVWLGDVDAFDSAAVRKIASGYSMVAGVNAALVLNLLHADGPDRLVVFENGNRAPEGAASSFFTKAAHIWSKDQDGNLSHTAI